MAKSVDWQEVFSRSRLWLWGKCVGGATAAGKIHAFRFEPPEQRIRLIFAEDLPGNRWISLPDTRLPLLAERVLQWSGQAVALVACDDYLTLLNFCRGFRCFTDPYPAAQDWASSGEVQYRYSLSHQAPPSNHEAARNLSLRLEWDRQPLPAVHPPEVWACVYENTVFFQAPGPWPTLFLDCLTKILEREPQQISFEVLHDHYPSGLQSPYLAVAGLYAAILALRTNCPIRFLVDEDFLRAWRFETPRAQVSASVEFTADGRILSLNVHSRFDAGFHAPLTEEYVYRFLYTFRQYFPTTPFWAEAWALVSHEAPAFIPPIFGETLACYLTTRLLQEIARLTSPEDHDPLVPLASFSAHLKNLDQTIDWRRLWGMGQFKLKTRGASDFGIGLAVGFHNSGFVQPALTSLQMYLHLFPDGHFGLDCPLPISGALMRSLSRSLPPGHEGALAVGSWYDAACQDSGPSLVGRAFEILTAMVHRTARKLLRKRMQAPNQERPRSRYSLKAVYRRPRMRSWNPSKPSQMPFLSSTPLAVAAVVRRARGSGTLHLERLQVVVEGLRLEDPDEVVRTLGRNCWFITSWLLGDFGLHASELNLEVFDSSPRSSKKGLQHALWTLLPAALVQAMRQLHPGWLPSFIREDWSVDEG